ncbi:MAG: hypothetical protein JWQ98_2866 [Chlorobi bacterium]|jgi:hypothetical protein|nr:hypothetical protein [Chlorobiota bacterium]
MRVVRNNNQPAEKSVRRKQAIPVPAPSSTEGGCPAATTVDDLMGTLNARFGVDLPRASDFPDGSPFALLFASPVGVPESDGAECIYGVTGPWEIVPQVAINTVSVQVNIIINPSLKGESTWRKQRRASLKAAGRSRS